MPDTTCHMSISLDGFVAGPTRVASTRFGEARKGAPRLALGDERANEADETAVGWLSAPARRLRHGPQHVRADPR